MHMLHLLRHAKSSWKEDVEDRKRRLNKRGIAAARLVGQHLPNTVGALDLVLCSSAARTRETLDLALAGFAARPHCSIEDELYLADCSRLIDRLRRLDENCASVLLIGHNPGLHDLAIMLAEPGAVQAQALISGKFPTAARASFRIDVPWAALGGASHRLVDYAIPAS